MVTSKNKFGKQQSDIDLAADEIIAKHLKASGVVYGIASEERPEVSYYHIMHSIIIAYCPK